MKVIDFMHEHIGKPVNLGFRSSFVYCDIVSDYIGAELAGLSDRWLTHEIILLRDCIDTRERLVTLGVNKYIDREILRWISRHRSPDNPDPVCPREMIKRFKTSYYNRIKNLNKDIKTYKKAIETFKPFGECEIKEVYTSQVDFKTLIVIGKGNKYVIGKYWTREEYLKDNKRRCFLMYEVIISGGPSDGHILGEFYSVADAADMIKAYNESEHHPDEYLIIRQMEV